MRKNYNLRQRKIYADYIGYSTYSLMEIVRSKKFVGEVIDVIEDILIERNAISENDKQENLLRKTKGEEENEKEGKDEYISGERKKRQLEVTSFTKKLENSSDRALAEIILKYPGYRLATIEAALIISEKRGIISSNEKEKLMTQIEYRLYDKRRDEKAKGIEKSNKSSRKIKSGLIFVVIGIILTIWSWNNSHSGYSYIFYGLIVSGAVLIIRGLLD